MLSHITRGEGPELVFMLHGFLGSGRNLASLARRWSERDPSLAIVLPDLTGHGSSPPLPPGADLETLARDVLELARALGAARPFVAVGHSLGGRVAVAMSRIDPGAIARVVLLDASVGSPGEGAKGEVEAVMSKLLSAPEDAASKEALDQALRAAGISPGLTSWLMTNVVERDGRFGWRFDRRALADLLPRTRSEQLWPEIERLGARLAVIRGDRSSFVGDADAERMARAGAHVETIAGAGHFLHVDRPHAVLEALIRAQQRSG